jgi:hypothetical protein
MTNPLPFVRLHAAAEKAQAKVFDYTLQEKADMVDLWWYGLLADGELTDYRHAWHTYHDGKTPMVIGETVAPL